MFAWLCRAMSSGRVASSHPAFNQHTFRPCEFFGFWNNISILHRANEPIYSVHGISPSPAGKGQHGRSQRGTWARKPLVRGISLKVVLLARLLLLGGHTSAPPNNPLILRYFGAFWVAKFWK